MDSKSDAGCPLCTCPIVEHQDNSSQSSADVADALPTEVVMEAIVESARVLGKDDKCTVCDDVRAEYICIHCLEKMCPSCMKIHKKMVVSRSHDVKSLRTMTPELLAASRSVLCAYNDDEEAKMFCVGHSLVICTSCFSNKHKKCPNVKTLNEEIESAEYVLESLTEELVKAEDNLKEAIDKRSSYIQKVDKIEQHNKALVDKTCDQLQKMVEECRNHLKELISDSFSNFKISLRDVKRELEIRLWGLTSHKHLVTRATTVRPRPALIHAAQTLTDRVHSLDLSVELEPEGWVDPSPKISNYCEDVLKAVKTELHSLQKHNVSVEVLCTVL